MITRIKIYFVISAIVVASLVIAGSLYLKDTNYSNGYYFSSLFQNIRSMQYSLAYSREKNIGVLAAIGDLFQQGSIPYEVPGRYTSSVPVLVYHGILDKPDGSDENILIGDFQNQMFALKRAGYNTITTDDLYKFLKGEKQLPEKSFLLTFDDGRKDSYYKADPLLKALGYKAVIFAITKFATGLKSSYYLTRDEFSDIIKSGRWEVEAHAKNGHRLDIISPDGTKAPFYGNKLWLPDQNRNETNDEFRSRIQDDLSGAKSDLENIFGIKVSSFAFPFGDFGQNFSNYPEAQQVATDEAKNDFNMMFYQNAPGMRFTGNYFGEKPFGGANSFLVKRILVKTNLTPDDIIKKIEYGATKSLPYYDNFNFDNGWINAWGTPTIESGLLTLNAKEGETGSAVVLDGSHDWTDYALTATVKLPKNNGVYVWVRFQDDNNNAACNIGRDFAHVEETIGGKSNVLKGIREKISLPSDFFTVTAMVKGREISCYLDGKLLVSSPFLDPSLDKGGVGFKAWDYVPNNSEILVKDVSVIGE